MLKRRTLRCLIPALAASSLLAAAAEVPNQPAFRDAGNGELLQTAAGLRWTRTDSPHELNWSEAKAWCAAMGPGWRLPLIAELGAAAMAPFQLQGAWHWSGTAVTREQAADFDELAWGLTRANGRPTMALQFSSWGARALCVHAG